MRHDSGKAKASVEIGRGRATAFSGRLDRALKRTIAVALAATLLVLGSPLIAFLALAIKLDSKGPVFYRCRRVGRHGCALQMLKFRKMRADATGGALTLAEDERLTRLGRRLARTHLDELPQLWHVLTGEMSLVGPRPESPDFVRLFAEEYAVILQVRPGLTGFTQVAFAREGAILDPQDPTGHYLSSMLPQKVELDRLYAGRRPSLVRDIKLMIATAVTLAGQPIAVDRTTGALTLRRRAAPDPGPRHSAGEAGRGAVPPLGDAAAPDER
jgi:lipopolysaccharide/colanic/teichoic acid biosynthesis glycosyltransferase